ncbi:MAG: winged helix-turn-helix transcriptional regulator, partial [Patescibacteria group bacterium]|nr:winged helix-turn-helix transcriptional regulator [Patescibacteria group bacterium]
LADETRLHIVRYLLDTNEMTCQDLMKKFPLSQPTLSHHFNKLVDARILNSEKDGVLWIYRLNRLFLKESGIDIDKLTSQNNR